MSSRMIRVLLAHNYYQQAGGEDTVFKAEVDLLRQRGHEVVEFIDHNQRIERLNRFNAFMQTIWSSDTKRKLHQELRNTCPDIAHFHNTFLLMSPSVYYACRDENVPVVQTLHNYRLICPAASFFRDGRICEDCMGNAIPWPGVWHGCYRRSRVQTTGVSAMLVFHRLLNTWDEYVNTYIALSNFSRLKYIEGGLPANKIVVKPNFVIPDPGNRVKSKNYAIAISRLSPEKGLFNLLSAWKQLKVPTALKIVGDGPQKIDLERFISENKLNKVELAGRLSYPEVISLIKEALFVVFPSQWYENFPMVIIESFACGVPVIASGFGSMAEIIDNERTGLTFSPKSIDDLAQIIDWALRNPARMAGMGFNARKEYERKYTADSNYQQLMEIYYATILANR